MVPHQKHLRRRRFGLFQELGVAAKSIPTRAGCSQFRPAAARRVLWNVPGRGLAGPLKRPLSIQELEQIAFVRLIPMDLPGWNEANVEVVHLRRLQQTADEALIF